MRYLSRVMFLESLLNVLCGANILSPFLVFEYVDIVPHRHSVLAQTIEVQEATVGILRCAKDGGDAGN